LGVVTALSRRGRSSARWSESPIFVLFLLPAVIFLAFTSLYPLARTLWLSFHTWFMNKPNTSPQWVGLGSYQATLADGSSARPRSIRRYSVSGQLRWSCFSDWRSPLP
jgi:ABC-type sugar transport system permease subunit